VDDLLELLASGMTPDEVLAVYRTSNMTTCSPRWSMER
jgi:uncharacterized protein (DUF433 family)